MINDFKNLFCEESVLVDRYNLTAGLVHHIQLLFELFGDYNNVDTDIELIMPCILFVLAIHDFEIDLRDEAFFMAITYFDKKELSDRQLDILVKLNELSGYCQERTWCV